MSTKKHKKSQWKASPAIHRKDHRKARFRYTDYPQCVGPVICCYRFFRLPLPRLLPGDFSIYPGVDFNDKPSLIRYNTNQSIFAHYGMRGRFSMEANVINELQNGLRRINWRVLSGCRRILHWSTRFVNKCELEKFMTEYGGGRRCPTYCTTGR